MKWSKDRVAEAKGELLSRFTYCGGPSFTIRAPGLNGPHPVLSLVLKTLAGNRRTVEEHLSFYLVWFEIPNQIPEVVTLDAALKRTPSLVGHAIAGMIETMRQFADMWIDSGKSSTDPGWDAPADRNVEDVLPGQSWSLFEWLDGILFARHPIRATLRRDGSMGIGETFPRYSETHEDRATEDRLKEYGAKFAAYWFVKLLDSTDARRIARCDACKVYFAYQRVRLRSTKRGVFCSRCKGRGSSKRNEISRAKRLDTAARAWRDWLAKHKGAPEIQWIAEKVNNAHGTSFGRRWVSQHKTKIQQRVEALRNAER